MDWRRRSRSPWIWGGTRWQRGRLATRRRLAMAPPPGSAGGDLGSREEAFATLLRVAEFFRRSEPHSPVSYTLEELVRRGRMSLPDLLSELINDPTQRRNYYVVAGMKPPEEPQPQ